MYQSVHALTWVVRDVDKAVAGWTKLGFEGIRVLENVTLTDVRYRGKPAACRAKVAEGYLGDVPVQWIQPLDGCGAYADFLARHGDGVFSLVHQAPTREAIHHLTLDVTVRAPVLAASAATLDRMLRPTRASVSGQRVRRRAVPSVQKNVPVRALRLGRRHTFTAQSPKRQEFGLLSPYG